jgi:hypothetical protein
VALAWLRRKDNAQTIDLRESNPIPRFGQPQPCPACDGVSFLDRIDVRNRIQFQTCMNCGDHFSTTEAELSLRLVENKTPNQQPQKTPETNPETTLKKESV